MPSNRINTHFSAEQRDEAKVALAALAAKLPFLIDLTAEERAAMPRFGDKSRGFISKALDIAEGHEEILPRSFGLDEFRADVEVIENLYAIRHGVETLLGKLNDTWFAARQRSLRRRPAGLSVRQGTQRRHRCTRRHPRRPRPPLRPQIEQARTGGLIGRL